MLQMLTRPPNRTIVELKLEKTAESEPALKAPNRTIVELKYARQPPGIQ